MRNYPVVKRYVAVMKSPSIVMFFIIPNLFPHVWPGKLDKGSPYVALRGFFAQVQEKKTNKQIFFA